MVSDDPPRRWDDDSTEEDYESHRAHSDDDLTGYDHRRRHEEQLHQRGMPGPVVDTGVWQRDVPDWWHTIDRPEPRCALCEHGPLDHDRRRRYPLAKLLAPAAGDEDARVCAVCFREQQQLPEPDPTIPAWRRLSAEDRRFYVAGKHHVDPWSGRRCQVGYIRITGDEVERVPLNTGPVPRGRWDEWCAKSRGLN